LNGDVIPGWSSIDRSTGLPYEPRGREFESLRARHLH
jgi:hypothetical protein